MSIFNFYSLKNNEYYFQNKSRKALAKKNLLLMITGNFKIILIPMERNETC